MKTGLRMETTKFIRILDYPLWWLQFEKLKIQSSVKPRILTYGIKLMLHSQHILAHSKFDTVCHYELCSERKKHRVKIIVRL